MWGFTSTSTDVLGPIPRLIEKSSLKINLDELDFLSTSNLNFAGYTGSKNQVHPTWFFQLDFLKIKFRAIGGMNGWKNLKFWYVHMKFLSQCSALHCYILTFILVGQVSRYLCLSVCVKGSLALHFQFCIFTTFMLYVAIIYQLDELTWLQLNSNPWLFCFDFGSFGNVLKIWG
jgi:hypothetical protein